MKKLFLSFLGLTLVLTSFAQNKYWVYYGDKSECFDPLIYFSEKAIERRILQGIPLVQETDKPVNLAYSETVKSIVNEEKVVSRWFNASCVMASDEQINEVKELPFVSRVESVISSRANVCGSTNDELYDISEDDKDLLTAQINRMRGKRFIDKGVNGKGVRIAVFDIGFESWKTNPAFEHLRKGNQILKTYDFVKKRENVDGYNEHGTFVLSCIAGKIEGQNIGLATGAEFLLARTETWREFYSEEEYWVQAAEWADKEGADIINSSLGYTYHRYFPEQMNGRHSLVSKAAGIAVSKGILVVNSAGNDGDNDWKIVGAPADNDSVLSIGGIKPYSGIHTSFSSFGPNANRHLKPNVTGYGHVIGSGPKGVSETQGTSFSSPLIAGFAACAKQLRPAYNAMALFHEIEKSSDLYPYFDYAHGYGVPQASHFFGDLSAQAISFNFINENTLVRIELAEKDTSAIDDEEPEYQHTKWPNYVFFHIENKKGYLDKYFVVDPVDYMEMALKAADEDITEQSLEEIEPLHGGEGPLTIKKSDYSKPFIIRAYYKGYSSEITIE